MLLSPGGALAFPDPRTADDEGLVAIGGDLRVERLLLAYERGIFPWYDRGLPPLWWSPNPRAVMDPERLHVSRSLRRRARRTDYTLSWNRAFRRVVTECGRQRAQGTWVLPEMIDAYTALHREGHAHSIEVWVGDELAGGLYGVQRGALFAAESMFHRRTGASKLALIACVTSLFRAGTELFDVQFLTDHLASLGAYVVDRDQYLERLADACRKPVDLLGLSPTFQTE